MYEIFKVEKITSATMLGKNVYTKVTPYNFASLPPIPLIFFLETR